MICKICGSEWHKTENCPKQGEETEPDKQTGQTASPQGKSETELPEYAEASLCHYRSGGG
jgi:hypothetical protein